MLHNSYLDAWCLWYVAQQLIRRMVCTLRLCLVMGAISPKLATRFVC